MSCHPEFISGYDKQSVDILKPRLTSRQEVKDDE